jgi:chromosome segregation ATPase
MPSKDLPNGSVPKNGKFVEAAIEAVKLFYSQDAIKNFGQVYADRDTLLQQNQEYKDKIQQLNSDIDSLKLSHNQELLRVDKLRHDAYQGVLSAHHNFVNTSTDEKNDLNKQLEAKKDDLEKTRFELQQVQSQLSKAKDAEKSLNEKLKSEKDQARKLKDENKNKDNDLKAKQAEFQKLNSKLTKTEGELSRTKETLADSQKATNKVTEELKDTQKFLDKLNGYFVEIHEKKANNMYVSTSFPQEAITC